MVLKVFIKPSPYIKLSVLGAALFLLVLYIILLKNVAVQLMSLNFITDCINTRKLKNFHLQFVRNKPPKKIMLLINSHSLC